VYSAIEGLNPLEFWGIFYENPSIDIPFSAAGGFQTRIYFLTESRNIEDHSVDEDLVSFDSKEFALERLS
jgi:hypothetical protein